MTSSPDWFRETPESLSLLEVERAKVAAAEAAYEAENPSPEPPARTVWEGSGPWD